MPVERACESQRLCNHREHRRPALSHPSGSVAERGGLTSGSFRFVEGWPREAGVPLPSPGVPDLLAGVAAAGGSDAGVTAGAGRASTACFAWLAAAGCPSRHAASGGSAWLVPLLLTSSFET